MVLANAQMITPDTGAAAIGIAAHWSFWRWIRAPSWHRATVAGLLLGLAQLKKFTWVVLPPLLKRWLEDHPQVQLSGVAYTLPQSLLHAAGPRLQGQKLPPPGTGKDPAGLGPRPGWYVVFVHHLRRSDERYAYFLEFEPVAMVGYTAYVYHISAEDVKRFHSARHATPSCRASGRASPRSGFGSDVQAE